MSTEPTQVARKTVTLPEELWEKVVEYRHTHRIASQAEAVRRLIDAALEAEQPEAATRE